MAKKATSRKKKTTKKGTKSEQQAQKQMWAVVLFAVGILLLFLTFIEGSKLWKLVHNLLFGLFGWASYFVAPLCIYIAVLAAKDKPMKILKAKLWQSGILLLFISGTIEVFGGLPRTKGLFSTIAALYQEGVLKQGGGAFGIILAGPLSFIGGPPVPQILIIIGLFVFLMLVTGSTLLSLYYAIAKPVKGVGEAVGGVYGERMETRRVERERREQERVAQEQLALETTPTGKFKWNDSSPTSTTPIPKFTDPQTSLYDPAFSNTSKFNIDIDISDDKTPEDFETAPLPLEPITKDLAGASLIDPPAHATMSFTVPEEVPTQEEEPEKTLETFGIDYPVEYISFAKRQQLAKEKAERETELQEEKEGIERPHPLEEDIVEAEEEDVLKVVQEYLEDVQNPPIDNPFAETEEPVEIETFQANVTPTTNFSRPTVNPFASTSTVPQSNNFSEIKYHPEPTPWKAPVSTAEELPNFPAQIFKEAAAEEEEECSLEETGNIPLIEPEPVSSTPKETNLIVETEKPVQIEEIGYHLPPIDLLEIPEQKGQEDVSAELKENAAKLVSTLESFGVKTTVIDVARGPSVTRYELQPSPGVKISKITGLADDIALNLAAAGIRIEAPIPNKAAVGIEVPNKNVSLVRIREIIDSPSFHQSEAKVAMALGKDITGNITIADIAKMPHMLIAGATGSGKSVCINSIIISILYKYSPDEVKLLMIDPKVVELGVYNGIPHLLVPVVTDSKKAAGALSWAVAEMLKRYQTFAQNGVRDITGYNRQAAKDDELEHMPQVVIIIDELADLMMASPADVEDSICRLAQMARAAGMHLVIATQRPSVDVITGVIKANIPSRIAFSVSSQVDSRTILDMGGAEKLLGRGDMLFYPSGAAKPIRVQGCFVTDQEVERVVEYVKTDQSAEYDEDIADEIDRLSVSESTSGGVAGGGFDDEDEMIPYAIEVVVDAGQGSTSLLQRRLKLGYARAARIMDQLEERGIVGPSEGSKPRQLLITKDQYIEMKLAGQDQPNAGGQTRLED